MGLNLNFIRWVTVLVAFFFTSCSVLLSLGVKDSRDSNMCYSEDCLSTAKRIQDYMDPTVSPCEDFYKFTCGGYERTAVIPKDREVISYFDEATDVMNEKIKNVTFKEISSDDARPYKLLKTYVEICMDEGRMDNLGLEPALRRIKMAGGWPVLDQWSREWDLTTTLATLYKTSTTGGESLFKIVFDSDFKNSSKRLITLEAPNLGLSRAILINGTRDARVKPYFDFMVDVAVIFGAQREPARVQLWRSLALEIEMAKLIRSSEDSRNLEDSYNPYTLQKLQHEVGLLDWRRFFNQILPEKVLPLKPDDIIMVPDKNYLTKLGGLLRNYPQRTVANHIMWQAVDDFSKYLTTELKQRRLKLNKDIHGIVARQPRWKECLEEADKSLELALGSIYVKYFFDQKSREAARNVASDLHGVMHDILSQKVDWMDDETRVKALDKLSKMRYHIGYPDELLDMDKLDEYYKGVSFERTDDFLSVVIKLNVFERNSRASLLREPIDRHDWRFHGNTNEVGAWYSVFENCVMIPAGILQDMFFSKDLPIYVNLAKIGLVVGHEITHAFDDMGSQTDGEGNLRNWWTDDSLARFREKTQCMVNLFGGVNDSMTGLKVNGANVQGETVADQGGLAVAYRAWESTGKEGLLLPGLPYTKEQVMLMSAGNMWCQKQSLQSRKLQLLSDPHPPADIRINGLMKNFPHFREIFKCGASDPMVSGGGCVVW